MSFLQNLIEYCFEKKLVWMWCTLSAEYMNERVFQRRCITAKTKIRSPSPSHSHLPPVSLIYISLFCHLLIHTLTFVRRQFRYITAQIDWKPQFDRNLWISKTMPNIIQ